MKILYILAILLFINCVSCDPCTWEAKLNAQLKKLTKSGQVTAKQIIKDLYYIMGAGVQPVFDFILINYSSQINEILNSTDASKLKSLYTNMCFKNSKCSTAYFTSYCANYKKTYSIVASFTDKNRILVENMIETLYYKVAQIYPSFLAINQLLDASLYSKLMKSEKKANLDALAQLFIDFGV